MCPGGFFPSPQVPGRGYDPPWQPATKGGYVRRRFVGFTIAALLATVLGGAATANAATTVAWVGNGLDSLHVCQRGVERPHLHWVLSPGGMPVPGTTAELFINGKDAGTMVANGPQGALQLTISAGPKFSIE